VTDRLERLRPELPTVSVGVLTADLLRLGEELDELARAGVAVVHVDVMDGVFCPPLTVGLPVVNAIPERFVTDVHLMVDEPLGKVEAFAAAGADVVTFHVEATRHPHRVLGSLRDAGVARGVALNPGTPVTAIEPLLDELELVLVLAVDPGWPGQSFHPSTPSRLAQARELIGGGDVVLGVDGGITRANVAQVAGLDVDVIVTGSAVFDGASPYENARFMQAATRGARADTTGSHPPRPPVAAGVDPQGGTNG
jgi:ribulose-phosphate 3-epimerase